MDVPLDIRLYIYYLSSSKASETCKIWQTSPWQVSLYFGDLEAMRKQVELGFVENFTDTPSTCEYIAAGGNLPALQYARELGCSWDENTCRNAGAFFFKKTNKMVLELCICLHVYTHISL